MGNDTWVKMRTRNIEIAVFDTQKTIQKEGKIKILSTVVPTLILIIIFLLFRGLRHRQLS
jgi:heme/copper-type cytochrome/quinol oxidase subunit 2